MKVKLSHASNPDIPGYWEPPIDSGRPRWVSVETFRQASEVCREFIERNGLGGGNWMGGEVRDKDDKPIAYVSYNGRVWEWEGKMTKNMKEIKV